MHTNMGFYNVSQLFKLLKICSKNNYSRISIKTSSEECFELKANEPISKNIYEFLESLVEFKTETTEEHIIIKINIKEDFNRKKRMFNKKFEYRNELNQFANCLFIDNGEQFSIIDEVLEDENYIRVQVPKYFYKYLSNNVPL